MYLTSHPYQQMSNILIAMLLSFPNGASWSLRSTYGPKQAQRSQMWMAIVDAIREFVGLGQDCLLGAVIAQMANLGK
jgi:hypothetical protein